MRDRLIELLEQGHKNYLYYDQIADHLIENGVIVPPCKVGDVVYVIFSTFYAEYKVRKFICDGSFVWAKLVNEEYEPQDREILRCISFDLNKTIFLDEKQTIQALKGGAK
jgi:hypothetical protein